ncbi:MAG: phytanoyl-CoA dioxygenase family protein [Anaerolineae bacterium]|nr:phytanoyl-CoA dioxygenase family protein [Candidatus Roseilinea sp.]MDW8449906.1 phytanoyl-CoA dioxygenase family protein [Anaerolineae bacterium]
MTASRLNDQQIAFYNTFGFLKFPGLLKDCIDRITHEFEMIWRRHGGGHHGKAHDGQARSCIVPLIDQSEYLSALLDDPRIDAIGTTLCGDDYCYASSDGNYYVGDTAWHSDTISPQAPYVKVAIYLDPLKRDTGALRVIPGSHLFGDRYADLLHEQVCRSEEVWGIPGRDVPAISLESEPGDVLCFNQNLKHAAFGGGNRRRMFTINFTPRYTEERMEDLRRYISSFARFWIDRVYGEVMIRTAGPKRMRHLEQIMANDGFLAELSRQARETTIEPSRG